MGKVGTRDCEMTIDSGAQLTLVRADLVEKSDYTGESLNLVSVCGRHQLPVYGCILETTL